MRIKGINRASGSSQRGTGLIPGQKVRGRVIARVGTGLFRVGAGGHIFNAQSDLPLHVGQRLTARVEYGDEKVFLKIIPDKDSANKQWSEEISGKEVQRILAGLGHQPTEMEIIEFIERLDRYRKYEKHRTVNPNAIWSLAIPWVRGIKGGGEMFALMTFTLRQLTLMQRRQLSPVSDFLEYHLCKDVKHQDEISPKTLKPEDIFSQRRQEAFDQLNTGSAEYGEIISSSTDDTSCILLLNGSVKNLLRWTDNPSMPSMVLETAESQGLVRAKINILAMFQKAEKIQIDQWINALRRTLTEADFQSDDFIIEDIDTHEALRFKFWRRWDKPTLFDFNV